MNHPALLQELLENEEMDEETFNYITDEFGKINIQRFHNKYLLWNPLKVQFSFIVVINI